eukprot:TRINITY_DN12510_c0_g1_i1.p1 TRINITY_DN12510_c0_g1~~TRINITY_DN12510_c0_g1_i1.p1  ORF type:complete len:305 (+),score=47.07 TRINITY_DN12510_c0_g1_i1:613-1527(+)
MTPADFIRDFETPNKPVIITGFIAENWPAFQKWDRAYMQQKWGDTSFRVGNGVEMTLRQYFSYCEQIHDEVPFYLFDKEYLTKCPDMADDFCVPEYFTFDYFARFAESGCRRPAYRWNLIGPARSGSTYHKDPNCTSAWNGLISGRKKWILYPPDIPPPGVIPQGELDVVCPISTIEWFIKFYPEHLRRFRELWMNARCPLKPVEAVQQPGDILFIPNRWWHTALNLQESIAVTQNYVSDRNLPHVLAFLKAKEHPELFTNFSKLYPEKVAAWESAQAESNTTKPSFWANLTDNGTATFSLPAS